MKRLLLLAFLFASTAHAETNEELKKKPPRVIIDSPRSLQGTMECFDEAHDIWLRYFSSPDHRTYRRPDGGIDFEYLTAPATIFALQTRSLLVSLHSAATGTHIQMWGIPAVDMLDPAGAASRNHGSFHAKSNGRLQQSIDSFKICLAQSDPANVHQHATPIALPSTADELAKLANLKDKGIITQAEFDTQKAKLLESR